MLRGRAVLLPIVVGWEAPTLGVCEPALVWVVAVIGWGSGGRGLGPGQRGG
jgi:hypothetical protein